MESNQKIEEKGKKKKKKEGLKSYYLDQLLGLIKPAIRNDNNLSTATITNIYNTIDMLKRWSNVISNAEEKAKLKIVPAIYRLESGKVYLHPKNKKNSYWLVVN